MGCEFAFALSFFISYIWMPSKKYLSLSGNINWRLSIISVKNKRSFVFGNTKSEKSKTNIVIKN